MKWEDEIITDDSGWKFKMPKLTREIIKKYGFGTFDLADWTFGTPYAIITMYKHVSEFNIVDKVVWKIENKLRYWEWKTFFGMHESKGIIRIAYKLLHHIVRPLRLAAFNLGWELLTWNEE